MPYLNIILTSSPFTSVRRQSSTGSSNPLLIQTTSPFFFIMTSTLPLKYRKKTLFFKPLRVFPLYSAHFKRVYKSPIIFYYLPYTDLKEINSELTKNNIKILINKKSDYSNILNIPYDQEIFAIELFYNETKILDINRSWNNTPIIDRLNLHKIPFCRILNGGQEYIYAPEILFTSYLTLQNFLNFIASPIFIMLAKQPYSISSRADLNAYESSRETEETLLTT